MVTGQSSGHPIVFDGSVWRYRDSGQIVNHERACSHCGRACVVLSLTVPATLSHSGEARVKDCGIDSCIAPIVKALNDGGVPTIACCCGHGKLPGSIVLADGRELIVAADFDEARRVIDVFANGQTIYGDETNEPERIA